MFFKRFINAAVTVPPLLIICAVLLLSTVFIGKWMDAFEQTGANGFIGTISLLVSAIAWLVTFGGAVVFGAGIPTVLITGTGILWRRVDQDDFLQDKNGKAVHFEKSDLIWRFGPIFKGQKLFYYDSF